jgi:septal ring factor EnvC (AmiA/AmiB activator)
MTTALIISIVFGILSLLVGGGLLTRYISHSNDLAVQAHDIKQTKADIAALQNDSKSMNTQVALLTQTLNELKPRLEKLDLLELLNNKLDNLNRIVDTILPRPEAEVRFKAVEDRVTQVSDAVSHITHAN